MDNTDRILAVISILGLILFTGVVVVFVRELDLAMVVLICLAMGANDFWRTFKNDANGASGK